MLQLNYSIITIQYNIYQTFTVAHSNHSHTKSTFTFTLKEENGRIINKQKKITFHSIHLKYINTEI